MSKALKRSGIAILLLGVSPIGVVIAINQFDEKLDPKAASYGGPRAPGVPEAENGYYALVALGAGDGAEGMAYAKASIAEWRAAAQEDRLEKYPESKRARRPELCDSLSALCLTVARAKPDEAKTKLNAYREDLERYDRLLAFRRYEEVRDFPQRVVVGYEPYYITASAQKAHLLRAALAIEAGNLDDALNALERDFAYQRVMLEGARTLVGKMIASTMYARDLAFAADLMRNRGAELAPHVPRLHDMLKPLSAAALSLSSALEMEFAFTRAVCRDPAANWQTDDSRGKWFSRMKLLYKPNATINRAYQHHLASVAAAEAPLPRVAAESMAAARTSGEMRLWDYINNPIGNVLVGTEPANFGDYRLRLHDLDGYNRLIGLWVELIGAGLGADGVADFVAKSEPRFHDPYTGKPMIWNASAKQLSFKAQGRHSGRKQVIDDIGRIYVQM